MPKPLNLSLVSKSNLTGDFTSPEVDIPIDVDPAYYATIIISAPISPLNIFDISAFIDVFEDGEWRTRDSNVFHRDLVNGPLEAVNYTVNVRIERLAGKKVRARLSCGQSVLSATVSIG